LTGSRNTDDPILITPAMESNTDSNEYMELIDFNNIKISMKSKSSLYTKSKCSVQQKITLKTYNSGFKKLT
jgi:hypothetical protein